MKTILLCALVVCVSCRMLHGASMQDSMHEFEFLAAKLGISTNSVMTLPNVPFFKGDCKSRICGDFIIKKDINAPESGLVHIYTKNGERLLAGIIHECKTFDSVKLNAVYACLGGAASPIEIWIKNLISKKDVGDFFIATRDDIKNGSLFFARGNKTISLDLVLTAGRNFNMMSIAKAIDEAILADAKEYQQTRGKDASQ